MEETEDGSEPGGGKREAGGGREPEPETEKRETAEETDGGPERGGGRREAGGGPEPEPETEKRETGEESDSETANAEPIARSASASDEGAAVAGVEEAVSVTEPGATGSPAAAEPPVSEPMEEPVISVPLRRLRSRSRRDFLLFGAGTLAAAAGFWWLLPDDTRARHLTPRLRDWLDSLDARLGATRESREKVLNRALTFDDDVAEALYSPNRRVRTYSKSEAIEPRNNYNGATPRPDYIAGWTLTVSGLESGRTERFTIENLRSRFGRHEQVTRLCCVEGWSAVAWWGGLSFAEFLRAHPPAPGSRWAKLVSSVNLDFAGRPDPYYVSIDLPTALHPQTLLATELSGRPLTVEHGAPLRLVAPMKLGLKNIKAITSIEYTRDEPGDYWGERGYSRYDGL